MENTNTAMPAEVTESAAAPAAAAPTPAPPTQAELDELRAQAAKAAENWDRLMRLMADFDNYKKRAARDKQDAIRFANEGLLLRIIPVLDNLEAALAAAANTPNGSLESLVTGITMVQQQLRAVLTEAGVEDINAESQPFDPKWHEAVGHEECAVTPEGHVLRQIRKGYKLRERLLRPATVVVARPPAEPAPAV
jgi:molecular chaperone GrpE